MAKRKPQPEPPASDDVMVIAVAGFKHDGAYVRTGDTVSMSRRDALDLRALNMVRILDDERSSASPRFETPTAV